MGGTLQTPKLPLTANVPSHAAHGYAPDPREMEFALRAIMRGCEREAEVRFGDARYATVMSCYKLARDGLGLPDAQAHSSDSTNKP